jgi:hypothetical protein
MSNKNKLLIIKGVHTILWVIIVYLIGYIWYAGIFNKITRFLWVCIICVTGEGLILLTNGGICPFTHLAANYTNNHEPGFDIFLPKLIAKYNIPLFLALSVIGGLLVGIRVLNNI